jgi:hypothetical protein
MPRRLRVSAAVLFQLGCAFTFPLFAASNAASAQRVLAETRLKLRPERTEATFERFPTRGGDHVEAFRCRPPINQRVAGTCYNPESRRLRSIRTGR